MLRNSFVPDTDSFDVTGQKAVEYPLENLRPRIDHRPIESAKYNAGTAESTAAGAVETASPDIDHRHPQNVDVVSIKVADMSVLPTDLDEVRNYDELECLQLLNDGLDGRLDAGGVYAEQPIAATSCLFGVDVGAYGGGGGVEASSRRRCDLEHSERHLDADLNARFAAAGVDDASPGRRY